MPRISMKMGFARPDGSEEVITQYLCDWPNCANIGEHFVGVIAELRALCIVCDEHALALHLRAARRPLLS